MKTFTWMLIAALLIAVVPAAAQQAPGKATAAFEKLKSVAGEWETKTPEGKPARASFELVSAGTVLMQTDHAEGMVTVYHPDRDRLVMTHYCAANNQPRMSAAPPAGEIKTLTFSFLDATNLAGPADGHMHQMVMTFQDKDHLTQEWTWKSGQEEKKETFQFQRKK